jgi:WXG100 family type VII secretion target
MDPDPYGYLHVSFPVMEQGGQDLAGVHATLVSTLEQLTTDLNTTLSAWTSDAQHAFDAAQKAWHHDADEMATTLSQFGTYIQQAGERYVNTEAKNTGIWA